MFILISLVKASFGRFLWGIGIWLLLHQGGLEVRVTPEVRENSGRYYDPLPYLHHCPPPPLWLEGASDRPA